MGSKIKILLFVSLALLLGNVWLFFSEPSAQQLTYNPEQYHVKDTAAITSVTLITDGDKNELSNAKSWMLNDTYKADPVFIRILMNVVAQIRLARPLSAEELSQIKRDWNRAIQVNIKGLESKSYWILGNPNRTETYVISSDQSEAFVAEIPGYSDYLGSIFELTTEQWRDRVVLDGNWRSIQNLSIDYKDASMADLEIQFNQDFFEVDGLAALDSNLVVDYLNLFEDFQANERINLSRFPRLDSLSQTSPLAIVRIEDIYFSDPQTLTIYPGIDNSKIQLALDMNNEPVIFDVRRLSQVLKRPEDFTY